MNLDYRINKINKTGLCHFPNLLSLKKVSEIKNKLNKVYEIRKSKKVFWGG